MQRRLSTILAVDVVGYSARMHEDEAACFKSISALREMIITAASKHDGRLFHLAGDGFLLEFSSPVAAVRCGYEAQLLMEDPITVSDVGFSLRIGIHTADVVVDGDDLFGDGVNVASRIEAEAEPGEILVSAQVFEHVKRSSQLRFENLGQRHLKNIAEPVTVYSVVGELGSHSYGTALNEASNLPDNNTIQITPNSLIVLPFNNLSHDPDQEYFVDGLSEDLITELSRFPDIFVISRNASFGLKGVSTDFDEVGRKFGVRYCLEGGVRRLGNQVRVNAYLSNTETGEQVWTERSDGNVDELFDLQDKLVAKIVSNVAGKIERQSEATALRKRPNDLKAYDCFMRGLSYHRIGGVTKEDASNALHWFDEALKRDPQFGRAHAWRACAMATVSEWTGEDLWGECILAGRQAIELDETDAECHRIAGSIALYQRDFERSEYHFNRAIELNPSHAYIVGRMGELHNFLGNGKIALDYQQRAKLLDPFLPEYCRELEAIAYYVMDDFESCNRIVDEFTRLTRRGAAYRAAAATHLKDQEILQRAVRELKILDADFNPNLFVQTEFYKDRDISRRLESELNQALAAGKIKSAS